MTSILLRSILVATAFGLVACTPADPRAGVYLPKNAPAATAADQALAADLLREINALRAQSGTRPATADADLSAVARIHSRDMALGLVPVSVAGNEQRRQAAGLLSSQELVAARSGRAPNAAKRFIDAWAADPGHKQALVRADSRLGIGVAHAPNGLAYVTLMLTGGGGW